MVLHHGISSLDFNVFACEFVCHDSRVCFPMDFARFLHVFLEAFCLHGTFQSCSEDTSCS